MSNGRPQQARPVSIDALIAIVQTEFPLAGVRITGRGRTIRRQAELMAERRRANRAEFIRTYRPATHITEMDQWCQRNPNATFSIEGHTDSFGSPEYNIQLSEKRAESVKIWLVEMMQISPGRIQTRGFGNTKPIVSSDKSKEEQAPNRRVEIVVKTGRR